MGKRLGYEASGEEDDYVMKCMKCKHSYTRTGENDILYCSIKECRFERIHESSTNRKKEHG